MVLLYAIGFVLRTSSYISFERRGEQGLTSPNQLTYESNSSHSERFTGHVPEMWFGTHDLLRNASVMEKYLNLTHVIYQRAGAGDDVELPSMHVYVFVVFMPS